MAQLHKNFTEHQVGEPICRYLAKEIERSYIQEILKIKKTRFFALVKKYREDPEGFSIEYKRKKASRKIPKEIEDSIIKELQIEKGLIANPEVPLRSYNYSYIKDRLEGVHGQKESLSTILSRAKATGYYLNKRQKKSHDREVLTNYVGELIQHDSSHHKWSPYAPSKWCLITSIDDCSRYLLYYKLTERNILWAHIEALEEVALKYGLAYSYYVDCHSIFRFVQGRDSFWRNHYKVTDEADPQWKQVLDDLRVKLIYALSAQAKGNGKLMIMES